VKTNGGALALQNGNGKGSVKTGSSGATITGKSGKTLKVPGL